MGLPHDLVTVGLPHNLATVGLTHDLAAVGLTHDLATVGLTHDHVTVGLTHDHVTVGLPHDHATVPGNEAADSLAKEDTTQEQVDRSTSYPEVKTICEATQHSKWRHKHQRYNKADPY